MIEILLRWTIEFQPFDCVRSGSIGSIVESIRLRLSGRKKFYPITRFLRVLLPINFTFQIIKINFIITALIDLFINYFCKHHLPRFETLALKIKRKPADKSKQHASHSHLENQSEMFFTRANFLSRVRSFQNEACDVRKIIYEKAYSLAGNRKIL